MTYSAEFELEQDQPYDFEEFNVSFFIQNKSDKKKKIKIEIK